jgi:hypothetical protein
MKSKKSLLLNFLLTISTILIFSLIPWAEFLNANTKEIDEILNDNFYILIAIYYLFIILIYFVTIFLVKDRSKLYYITFISFSVWIFFQYNLLKIFFNSIFSGYFLWNYSSEISLLTIILLISILYFFLEKIKFLRIFVFSFMILNLIYFSITLYPKLNMLNANKKINIVKENFIVNSNFENNPNIYFFLVDAMKPLNKFENFYDLNLKNFKNHYEKYNYKYYPNTFNTYEWTDEVLTSFFYLEKNIYQNENVSDDNLKFKSNILKTFPTLLKNEYTPKLLTELKKFGYDFKWVGNYMSNCSKTNFKYCLKSEKKNYIDIYTVQSFLEKSVIIQIINKLIQINFIAKLIDFKTLHSDPIFEIDKYVISNKDLIINNKPKFFLIHDLETHAPYFVDSNCEDKRFVGRYNLEGYKNSYLCNIKKISKIIETLDKFDPSAIVVFQSDHSWIMSQKSESKYGMRTSIFNLIKNGKNCKNLPTPNNLNTLNFGLYILECLKINNK